MCELLPSASAAGVCEGPFPCARAGRSAARAWAREGPFPRAPGRALRRGAAARRVGERARFRASPKRMPRARAQGAGGGGYL